MSLFGGTAFWAGEAASAWWGGWMVVVCWRKGNEASLQGRVRKEDSGRSFGQAGNRTDHVVCRSR